MLNRSQNKTAHLQSNISLYYKGRQYSAHVRMHKDTVAHCVRKIHKYLLFITTNICMVHLQTENKIPW